ncbi:MAG: hypothetical protein OEQ28_05415, partial [Acidobacteriota bacterium]|nr:hypothetical protein [Acidobacteriota bacterium]
MSDQAASIFQHIQENFGANASYVEGLYNRFKSDPNLVDESWRSYFANLNFDGNGSEPASSPSGAAPTKAAAPEPAPAPERRESPVREDVEAKAIFGASKVIVDNMEQSLSV